MTDGVDAGASLQRAWREERAAVLATVARRLGDLQKAEDAVQEAFVAAAVRWPAQGVPDRPGAWLTTAAWRKALDALRADRFPVPAHAPDPTNIVHNDEPQLPLPRDPSDRSSSTGASAIRCRSGSSWSRSTSRQARSPCRCCAWPADVHERVRCMRAVTAFLCLAMPAVSPRRIGLASRSGFPDGPRSLLPCLRDLSRQVDHVDAGVVAFDVGPEESRVDADEGSKGAVVHGGSPLVVVADEQVPDRRIA